jgi:DNA-binding CsgD family transcriptional regulator
LPLLSAADTVKATVYNSHSITDCRHRQHFQAFDMARFNGLTEQDVRTVVRLLADVAILQGGLSAKKAALMEGLQKETGADGWLWSMTRVEQTTGTPICVGLMHAGLTDAQLTGWLEASQTSCPPPEDAPLWKLVKAGKHFTRTRQQVVPDSQWYSHPAIQTHRLRHGIDHFLYSIYPLDGPSLVSAVGLFRYQGRPPFADRESRIAHIVLSEVQWLHYAELPGDRGRKAPQLSPRQRVVLILLVEARDKDEIARLLHISPHTVKDHMKAIYELFGVSSQLELIRRFRFGDHGDELPADP